MSGEDDSDGASRFHCPHPGCKRTFAELWRLKVHYRADPNVRGSGKERGHGVELSQCPKCHAQLQPGRHHVGCKNAGPVSAAKRRKVSRKKLAALPKGRGGPLSIPRKQRGRAAARLSSPDEDQDEECEEQDAAEAGDPETRLGPAEDPASTDIRLRQLLSLHPQLAEDASLQQLQQPGRLSVEAGARPPWSSDALYGHTAAFVQAAAAAHAGLGAPDSFGWPSLPPSGLAEQHQAGLAGSLGLGLGLGLQQDSNGAAALGRAMAHKPSLRRLLSAFRDPMQGPGDDSNGSAYTPETWHEAMPAVSLGQLQDVFAQHRQAPQAAHPENEDVVQRRFDQLPPAGPLRPGIEAAIQQQQQQQPSQPTRVVVRGHTSGEISRGHPSGELTRGQTVPMYAHMYQEDSLQKLQRQTSAQKQQAEAEALAQAQAQAQQEPQPPKNFAELYSQEFREVNVSDDAPEQPGEQPQRQGSAQSLPSGSAPPPVNLAAPMPRRSSSFFNPFADTAQADKEDGLSADMFARRSSFLNTGAGSGSLVQRSAPAGPEHGSGPQLPCNRAPSDSLVGSTALALTGPEFSFGSGLPSFAELYPGGSATRARLSGLTPLDSWLTSAGLGPSPLSSLLSSWPRGAASGASQRRLAQSTPLEVPWPPQAALQQQADKSTAEQLQQLAHQTQQQTEASA